MGIFTSSEFNKLGTSLLGPQYDYVNQIKTPEQMDMSGDGAIATLTSDIVGIIDYAEVLITGGGKAVLHPDRPLGNQYFLSTLAKCIDVSTNESVTRDIWINNIPTGNIPFVSNLAGTDFNEFRGLIPGMLQDLEVLNPINFIEDIVAGPDPPCLNVSLPIIDTCGNRFESSGNLIYNDLYQIDPCAIGPTYTKPSSWVPQLNPLGLFPSQSCRSTFQNMKPAPYPKNQISDDIFVEIYFYTLILLGIYILFKLLHRIK